MHHNTIKLWYKLYLLLRKVNTSLNRMIICSQAPGHSCGNPAERFFPQLNKLLVGLGNSDPDIALEEVSKLWNELEKVTCYKMTDKVPSMGEASDKIPLSHIKKIPYVVEFTHTGVFTDLDCQRAGDGRQTTVGNYCPSCLAMKPSKMFYNWSKTAQKDHNKIYH